MKAQDRMLAGLLALVLAQCTFAGLSRAQAPEAVLAKSGHKRGIAAVLGDPECEFALELAKKSELTVYVQLGPGDDLQKACETVDRAGLYGTRVYVERGTPSRIGLADNLADIVVVTDAAGGVADDEVLRVLNPNGRAFVAGRELTKPFPEGADDWAYLNHGPDNNRLSADTVIKPPYLTQFYGLPHLIPLPMARVASRGRFFMAMGNCARGERDRPWLNTLCAFNGYNGVMLWKRPLDPARMIFQNTYIATPDLLYLGGNRSCERIDVRTGKTTDEITIGTPDGASWKWMIMDGHVLYALIGASAAPVATQKGKDGGSGGNASEKGLYGNERGKFEIKRENRVFRWGLGKTLVAWDLKAGKELWRYREEEPMEGRTVCMVDGRIYAFRTNKYLVCVSAADGKVVWRQTPQTQPELFKSVVYDREIARGYATRRMHNYMMCIDGVLVFRAVSSEGPSQGLAAASAADGKLLWKGSSAFFMVTASGHIASSRQLLDLRTGKPVKDCRMHTDNCAQITASPDSLYSRAQPGTGVGHLTGDLAGKYEVYPLMRPGCQNSVMPFCGHLYVMPYSCQCGLEMYGTMCYGSGGSFAFTQAAKEAERLEKGPGDATAVQPLAVTDDDWPTYRRSNDRLAATPVAAPADAKKLWRLDGIPGVDTTAPVAAGGLVFVGRSDGQVLALDAATGSIQWKAYTGGAVRWPPSVADGRAYVGSGDGYVYCLEAKTGRILWRFRCAPRRRKIPVYGKLLSTWPAASGVLVEGGRAYVAAGIASHDGTHVYALDAATGKIVWQDNTSGHIEPKYKGVCVQGHLLSHEGRLYLSAGCGTGVAAWDMSDGKLLRDADTVMQRIARRVPIGGRDLYLYNGKVYQSGNPFYMDIRHERRKDPQMYARAGTVKRGDRTVLYTTGHGGSLSILCYNTGDIESALPEMGRMPKKKPLWSATVGRRAKAEYLVVGRGTESVVVAANAVIATQREKLAAFSIDDGKMMWETSFPHQVIYWGLAVDREGRILATLLDGSVVCLGKGGAPLPNPGR